MAIATADIHIKVDPRVKTEAERNLKKYGISMSDLINVTLRGFNRERRMPYDATRRELPENMRIENREQLIAFIEKRLSEDDGTRYTIEQVREDIMQGRLRSGR